MKVSNWIKYKEIGNLSDKISVEICNESQESPIEFDVDTLEKLYFLGNDSSDNPVKGSQTSHKVELAIENILKKDKWVRKDVIRILGWKAGKINQNKSEGNCNNGELKFDYYNNWSEESNNPKIQLPNSNRIKGEKLCSLLDLVKGLRASYVQKEKSPEIIWEELVKHVTTHEYYGLGTVYLISLLFFITGGEKPIFDRFAMAALVVLELESQDIKVKKDSIIRGCSLPEKKLKAANTMLTDPNSMYVKYCELLKKHFPNEWQERRIDRALWVYGHYFNVQ